MKKIRSTLLIVLSSSLFTVCEAQYTTLLNFSGANGSQPYGSLTLSGSLLYGGTNVGGIHDSGCVFSVDTNGGSYQDLFDFNGTNGNGPAYGSLALSGNRLYGMTNQGGAHHLGCVYSIDAGGGGYEDLLDFNGTNGGNPIGSVIIYQNKLYGMSQYGGTHDSGCVFSLDTNGTNYKDLLDFNGTNGQFPRGSLTVWGSELFGMVNFGVAPDGMGGIFSLDTSGSYYKDLFNFSGVNGQYPYGDLILSGNKLYGMTFNGGSNGDGNVFSIDTNGYNFENIFMLGINGWHPNGDLILSGNLLYGLTTAGGTHDSGCIFSVDTGGIACTDLFDFNTASGANPYGSLTLSGTALFGTTSIGGTSNDGVVFRFKDVVLGIDKLPNTASGINVYPNPSSGKFTLRMENGETGNAQIQIYNVLGEQVYSKSYQLSANSRQLIDLSSQPNGIYLYRVIDESGELIGEGKVIIQK